MSREINDLDQINKVLDTLFKGVSAQFEADGEVHRVQVIDNKYEGLIVRLPKLVTRAKERILKINNKGNQFIGSFIDIGKDQVGNAILKPVKIVIRDAADQSKSYIATNIISQAEVIKSLSDERFSQILKNLPKVNYMFDFFEVFISERSSSRMRLMAAHDKPIFIPNIEQPEMDTSGFVPFKEYYEATKVNNVLDKFVAEICLPIKYKGFYLIGYIHAMHSKRMDINSFNTLKLVTAPILREIQNSQIFEVSKDTCQVSEVSIDGIRFLHPPSRIFTKTFSLGTVLIFDLVSGNGARKYVRAVIKAIKPMQKDFQVSCDFTPMTPPEINSLSEFLG